MKVKDIIKQWLFKSELKQYQDAIIQANKIMDTMEELKKEAMLLINNAHNDLQLAINQAKESHKLTEDTRELR